MYPSEYYHIGGDERDYMEKLLSKQSIQDALVSYLLMCLKYQQV